MPLVKRMESRLAFKPVRKADNTMLEDFANDTIISQYHVIPQKLVARVNALPAAERTIFIQESILHLIGDSVGLKAPKAKDKSSWYSTEIKHKGKVNIRYVDIKQGETKKGKNRQVVPMYTVVGSVDRKWIPVLDQLNDINTGAGYGSSKQTISYDVQRTIHNESYRLSEMFQMSYSDFLSQALERGLNRRLLGIAQASPNANRLKEFMEREDRQQNRTQEAIAHRHHKNTASMSGAKA